MAPNPAASHSPLILALLSVLVAFVGEVLSRLRVLSLGVRRVPLEGIRTQESMGQTQKRVAGSTEAPPGASPAPPFQSEGDLLEARAICEAITPCDEDLIDRRTSAGSCGSTGSYFDVSEGAGESHGQTVAKLNTADDGYFEVRLERSSGEAWGFAWHVGAHAAKRLLVAGVDPASPAGLWGAFQSEHGMRGIERGDELTSVNEMKEHATMRRELVAADVVKLTFRRADAAGAEAAALLSGHRSTRPGIAKRRPAPIAPPSQPPVQVLVGAPEQGSEAAPVCIKNTFLHVAEAEDTDETETFARSDPLPIMRLGDPHRRSSPYTPGRLAGVDLPPHIAAKMAAAPAGANLDASGTGSSSWSAYSARSKSSSDSADPAAAAKAAVAFTASEVAACGDEVGRDRSRCPSVSTEWDYPVSPYLETFTDLYPTAEVAEEKSPSTASSNPSPAALRTMAGSRAVRGRHIQNAALPSPTNRSSVASRAAVLFHAAGAVTSDSRSPSEAMGCSELTVSSNEVHSLHCSPPVSPPSTGSFRDNAPASLSMEDLPSAPAMTVKNTFIEMLDEEEEFDFNDTCKTMPDMWRGPGLLTSPLACGDEYGSHKDQARQMEKEDLPTAPAITVKNTFIEMLDGDEQEFDKSFTCKTMPDIWRGPGLLASPLTSAGGTGYLVESVAAVAAAIPEGQRHPLYAAPDLPTTAAPDAVESCHRSEVEESSDENGEENAQSEEPTRRKKPTRRAGRRARHRRCHAAEARRLAEEAAAAAAGESVADNAGLDPAVVPSMAGADVSKARPSAVAKAPCSNGASSSARSLGQYGECEGMVAALASASTTDAQPKQEPVRRGGRPPKKSVLAAQAAASAKVAATPDTRGLGLSPTAEASRAESVVNSTGTSSSSRCDGKQVETLAGGVQEGDPQEVLGKRVLVVGLIKQPAFNGEWGRVETYDSALDRFVVRVLRDTGPPLLAKLRRENLLVPPTVELTFEDDANAGIGLSPEAEADIEAAATASLPSVSHCPWLSEPAFVSYSQPPEAFAEKLLVSDSAAQRAAPTTSPAVADGSSVSAMVSAGQASREGSEKWRPTLRHWWGEADLDSSGTASSGPKDR